MEVVLYITGYVLLLWFLWWGYRKVAAHLDYHARLKEKVETLTSNNKHLHEVIAELQRKNEAFAARLQAELQRSKTR